jgi:hypothetical protein
MDVADDIAILTKNRKIYEAEEYFGSQRKSPIKTNTLLNYKGLKEIIDSNSKKEENLDSVSTFEICNLLVQLANHSISTKEDLRETINNSDYSNAIESAFKELNIRRDEIHIQINDSFHLLFICRDFQTDCESIRRKHSSLSEAYEKITNQRMLQRQNDLYKKIEEIKTESNFRVFINGYEVNKE